MERLQNLIDNLLDLASEEEPAGSYCLVLGLSPTGAATWAIGKQVYRSYPVVQSRLVPNSMVVLAPAPTNDPLIEFQGWVPTGETHRSSGLSLD